MEASCSSSSSVSTIKYDVFLSFRGEDTRDNFTSHLYHAFQKKRIQAFMDDKLSKGDEISPTLITAVEGSKISVLVFSENYANSKWCLDELVKILECRNVLDQIVLPVFYKVDPKDVRNQQGNFGSAFDIAVKKAEDKEERWRSALKDAGNLSGWDSSIFRSEALLIDAIVDDVWEKLKIGSYSYCDRRELVVMNSRIEKIMNLLCIESQEFGMVGIWGMGGVGKTALAEVIFHRISSKFESSCFLGNVREKTKADLVSMRNDLICKLLKEEKLEIGTPHIIDPYIKDRLRCPRVLVVIDEVDDSSQLEVLMGGSESVLFGPGSRVIVTCRDKRVLNSYIMARLYDMKTLHDDEALQLFSHYAFHQNQPPESYLEFSKIVVNYAKGVALPLKVLGSSLRGKTESLHWKNALRKLKEVPDIKILDVLKTSYDGLNTNEKDMFLDIACFFKGSDIDFVTKILDGCYSSAYSGIDALIDKSLITIGQNKKLEMHDLLQEMGWNIVLEESKEPGSRSRLWRPEDVRHVLTRNTGTGNIEGIFFDMSQVNEMNLDSQVFAKMCNLKFLKIYNSSAYGKNKLHFPRGLKSLPDELRYLSWVFYPFKCFPSVFGRGNLVALDMYGSNLKRLKRFRNPPQPLVNLKALRLKLSKKLVALPDLSSCTNLEELDLSNCEKLGKIPDLSTCTNLKEIDLSNCEKLVEIPSSIEHLNNLTRLNLSNCSKLKMLPSFINSTGLKFLI